MSKVINYHDVIANYENASSAPKCPVLVLRLPIPTQSKTKVSVVLWERGPSLRNCN